MCAHFKFSVALNCGLFSSHIEHGIAISYSFLQMEAILVELNFPVDVIDKFKEEKV